MNKTFYKIIIGIVLVASMLSASLLYKKTTNQKIKAESQLGTTASVKGSGVIKISGNPNGIQEGTLGDIAFDNEANSIYIKTSDESNNNGWLKLDQNEVSFSALSGIELGSPVAGDVLILKKDNKWSNQSPKDIVTNTKGLTIDGGSGSVLNGVTVNIDSAGKKQPGLLTVSDWKKFNGKQDALDFGNFSSVTPGVSIEGGDNAIIGSGITFSIANADGSHTGLLTSADYNLFSNKNDTLIFSGPLSKSTNTVSLNQATETTDGYLRSNDYNNFNNKISSQWSASGSSISFNSGNVGIGTSNPQYALDITTPSSSLINPFHVSASGGLEGITVDSSGLVGIGTSSPLSKLSVAGGATFGSFFSATGSKNDGDVAIEGKLGIGTLQSDARLHISAGTTVAGSAPLKIDSGTLLATAEVGAVEFNGTGLYYTDNASMPTRHLLAKDEVLFNTPIISQTVTYQHPRDPAELNGNLGYTYSLYTTYGMYEQMTAATGVSAIKANVWCTNTSRDVTFKVFARSDTTAFNPDSVTPLYSGTISHTIMPHTSVAGGSLFNLTSSVTVQANQYLFVIWESTIGGEINVSYFDTDSPSFPYRHPFIIGPVAGGSFGYTTMPTYSAATFRVYGSADITRTTTQTLGSEVVSNPGFETAGSGGSDVWMNWVESSSGGVDETTLVHSGYHAAKFTSPGINWFTPQASETITVTPSQKYQLSFWTRGDGTHAGNYAILDSTHGSYLNSSGGGLTTSIAGTTYTQVATTFTAPAGCTAVTLFLVPANVSGAVAYFDDVSIKPINNIDKLLPLSIQTVLNNIPSNAITFSDPNGIMTSTNVRDAIIEAYNNGSGSSATLVSPRIVLPDTLYAVVGDKLQLFARGMIEAQNPYNLPYVVDSSVGNSYPRYFEYTPVLADAGTKSITVKVLNYDYSVLTTKTINLKVVNPTGQPAANKKILCLGDSLTAGGTWPAELYRRLTQSGGTPAGLGYGNISFIGDKSLPGYSTQAYTGYGGWSFGLYNGTASTTSGHVLTGTFDKDKSDVNSTWLDTNGVTWSIEYATGGLKIHGAGTLPSSGTLTHVSGAIHTSNIVYTSATNEPQSPFWDSANSRLSFSNWATRNSYSGIDAVYVLLGWNSTGGANVTDYSTYMADVRTFLNQLHTDFPSTIVRLVGIQVPSVNGGLGANYGANGGLSEYYGMVRSANSMNIAYQNLANEAAYSSWVKFVSTAPQFDSENNMSQALTPVNSRNSATEMRGTNGVHPDTTGYYQIADAIFREFVNTFTSN